MLSLVPDRLLLGVARGVLRFLLRILRLVAKVIGAATAATAILFVLDMVLLGDKRREPERARSSTRGD